MDEFVRNAIADYQADASRKVAEWPARQQEEREAAAAEQRQPYPIVPLTAVEPQVLLVILDGLRAVANDSLAETLATLKRVCKEYPTAPFAMRSDQLLAVLKLAESSLAKG